MNASWIEIERQFGLRNTRALSEGLRTLAKRLPMDCELIEIGSYLGESATLFLESGHVRHIHCVDAYIGGYDPIDLAASNGHHDLIEQCFDLRMARYAGGFTKWRMTSREAAAHFGTVDAIYVDASHVYESVCEDLALYVPKVCKGGVIAGHDWDFPGVERAVTERLGTPDELFEDHSWMFRA